MGSQESQKEGRVLVLGAGGMLGNAVFRLFKADERYRTIGTLRTNAKERYFTSRERERLIADIDAASDDSFAALFERALPDVVVNCIGIIKQQRAANDPLVALSINSLLPHRLANLCARHSARLIHLSTDCVFSGRKGGYREGDFADADDLYGRSKYLGETDYPHALTLRTSIIGHELGSAYSLVDWFLSQKGSVKGFRRAIFSGLPAIEIARVIRDHVLDAPELHGVYHLSAEPIDKHALLALIGEIYGKDIEIVPDDEVRIDRSLNSERFREETGYAPPPWPKLIKAMNEDYHAQRERLDPAVRAE